MTDHPDTPGEDRFRPSAGSPGRRDQPFVNRILREAGRSGGARRRGAHRPGSGLGRGHVAAQFRSGADPTRRRVAIKTRLVNLKRAGQRSTATHLRYLEREGVGRDGEPGQAYGPLTDHADLEAFSARGEEDRHQFRFIVSPEDAESLEALRTFNRHLMARVEQDLGTRLDWVAVDHWNTDNPHTHVVLRGKDETGRDLIISRDYIAHGMRHRAGELATEWLGPRTEREIHQGLQREVQQERWTGLDRALTGLDGGDGISVRALARHPRRPQLVGRLQHLQRLGLAREVRTGHWHIEARAERTLRALGERGDIVRTLQRAMSGVPRELNTLEPGASQSVTGRLVAKGLGGESHDRGYLVIDGTDGRAHYLRLPVDADLSRYRQGAVIEARTSTPPRPMDERIASLAVDGAYHRARHREVLRQDRRFGGDPEALLDAHERRLEALRRSGIVERLGDGLWRVPPDLVEQGRGHDARRSGGVSVMVRSAFPLERQVNAMGATWLDSLLLGGTQDLGSHGFGAEVRGALQQRTDWLVEQGLAERRGTRVLFAPNLLATLRDRDVAQAARDIAARTGLEHRPLVSGQPASGVYRRDLELASGRYAVLEDGRGFSLAPWKPVIGDRLGQHLAVVARGPHVSWQVGRSRGPVIG